MQPLSYVKKSSLLRAIRTAKKQIEDDFYSHVETGTQTSSLGNSDLAACGQFLHPKGSTEQRGLHGTAAAIQVLSQRQQDGSQILVSRILKYLITRESIDQVKAHSDNSNVIKTSELLLALAKVKRNGVDYSPIINDAISRLKNAYLRDKKGWGYFTDSIDFHPLPTVYALTALSQHGTYNEVAEAQRELLTQLSSPTRSNEPSQLHLTTNLFIIYMLEFTIHQDQKQKDSHVLLPRIFRDLWSQIWTSVPLGLEQNVEYWKQDRTYYIRIPWDIYTIALAAHYKYATGFCSATVQRRLCEILKTTASNGFVYGYSGENRSSRTYAALYHALSVIERHVETKSFYSPFIIVERLRYFIGSRFVRCVVSALGVIVCTYIIFSYANSKDAKLSDIAPNLIAEPILIATLLLGKKQ